MHRKSISQFHWHLECCPTALGFIALNGAARLFFQAGGGPLPCAWFAGEWCGGSETAIRPANLR